MSKIIEALAEIDFQHTELLTALENLVFECETNSEFAVNSRDSEAKALAAAKAEIEKYQE